MKYRITIEKLASEDNKLGEEVYRQTFEDVDYHELIVRLNHKPRKRTRKEKAKAEK